MTQFLNNILYFDYLAWYHVNVLWRSSFLDLIIPFIRNQWFWAPLYLFLLAFMLMNYGKRGAVWCLFFLITFALSDQISAHLFKDFFQRTRPCFDPHFSGIAKLIVPCGGGYSFPSSHATNHFALAIFMAVTLGQKAKWIAPASILWAILVCYSQVYVGVHFPMDVIFGAFIGIIVGKITARLFLRLISLAEVNNELIEKSV